MIPCKECLVKAICIRKMKDNEYQSITGLECSLLESWLTGHLHRQFNKRLNAAYIELRVSSRSPVRGDDCNG